MERFTVRTRQRMEFVDITDRVARCIEATGVKEGICMVFVPHTTCGVTINENADPSVPADLIAHTASMVPRHGSYRHTEGNSDAHIKASLFGSSVLVPVTEGRPALGTWQGIFLCEFDGARTRSVWVQVVSAAQPGR